MSLGNILLITQIIVSGFLVFLILLQQRGQALGSTFGGSGEFYLKRRGIEKKMFGITIFLAALFIFIAILRFVV